VKQSANPIVPKPTSLMSAAVDHDSVSAMVCLTVQFAGVNVDEPVIEIPEQVAVASVSATHAELVFFPACAV